MLGELRELHASDVQGVGGRCDREDCVGIRKIV